MGNNTYLFDQICGKIKFNNHLMNSFQLKQWFPAINNFSQANLIQLGDYVANYILCEDRYLYCPDCIDDTVKKNGHVNGRQRGVCLKCGKSFNLGRPSLMYKSRFPKKLWHDFIVEMFRLVYTKNSSVPNFKCINKNTRTRMYNRCLDSINDFSEDLNSKMSAVLKTFSEENFFRIIKEIKFC